MSIIITLLLTAGTALAEPPAMFKFVENLGEKGDEGKIVYSALCMKVSNKKQCNLSTLAVRNSKSVSKCEVSSSEKLDWEVAKTFGDKWLVEKPSTGLPCKPKYLYEISSAGLKATRVHAKKNVPSYCSQEPLVVIDAKPIGLSDKVQFSIDGCKKLTD